MKSKKLGVAKFLTKQFPTDKSAEDFFAVKRWGDEPTCPYCNSVKIYKGKGLQPYKCSKCNRKFTVKTGTIMEGSHVPVRTWLLAMYLMGIAKKGISSIALAEQLAWARRMRSKRCCLPYGMRTGRTA